MNPWSFFALVATIALVSPCLGVQARGRKITPKSSKKVRSVNRRSTRDRKEHRGSCGCFSKKVAGEKK